jgi:hypothetical protein
MVLRSFRLEVFHCKVAFEKGEALRNHYNQIPISRLIYYPLQQDEPALTACRLQVSSVKDF